ncbi:cytochrome P450 [Epithele typhae]|uniref:cytochrome P450 n=1 Tax=Epithele typhae TaxID=378194 RepID=UPI002007A281|nr:cytochrome P450 [Epithele typhae]KAH9924330.1 cytochrome P450 [Epithele typhae]
MSDPTKPRTDRDTTSESRSVWGSQIVGTLTVRCSPGSSLETLPIRHKYERILEFPQKNWDAEEVPAGTVNWPQPAKGSHDGHDVAMIDIERHAERYYYAKKIRSLAFGADRSTNAFAALQVHWNTTGDIILEAFDAFDAHRVFTLVALAVPLDLDLSLSLATSLTSNAVSHYHELSQKYSSKLIYLNVFGQSLLVVDDLATATELFEKRSAIYSSRVDMSTVKLIGWEWNMAFLPRGAGWRQQRRMVWQEFHPGAVAKYQPAQREGARRLLLRLLDGPENFIEHVRYALASTIIESTYGILPAPTGDKYIFNADRATEAPQFLASAAAAVLQAFPALGRVPAWLPLPGTGILRQLEEFRMCSKKMRDVAWEDARRMIEDGHGKPRAPIATAAPEDVPELEELYKSVAAVVYAAGFDTTYGLLNAFFVAMAAHPEAQERAQAEIDAVIGRGRLPDFSDRQALPYVNAVIKEITRWHVSIPPGLAHATSEDDEFEGYFIPKGTAVNVNAWAILHDPAVFEDPETFKPERFMKDGKLDPAVKDLTAVAFGLGRRRPLDADGKPIPFDPELTEGLLVFFKDSRCVVRPRSDSVAAFVRQECAT